MRNACTYMYTTMLSFFFSLSRDWVHTREWRVRTCNACERGRSHAAARVAPCVPPLPLPTPRRTHMSGATCRPRPPVPPRKTHNCHNIRAHVVVKRSLPGIEIISVYTLRLIGLCSVNFSGLIFNRCIKYSRENQ